MSDNLPARPGRPGDLDDIPVDELIRLTREFTRRITNQDRQRLGVDLRESGHQRLLKVSAPVTLQQFFAGEIDLDAELAQRFANAPLLSSIKFLAPPAQTVTPRATALLSSNDDSFGLAVDALLDDAGALEFSFTLFGAFGARFRLSPLGEHARQRWLELMRRPDGIAFLWTRQRWDDPHLIFVVREYYGRVYAFSPHGIDAAARLTPDMISDLLDWLEDLWFPGQRAAREAEAVEAAAQGAADWSESPTYVRRPPRRRPHLRATIPDAPEEQWDDEPPAEPDPALDDFDDDGAFDADDAPDSGGDLGAEDLEW